MKDINLNIILIIIATHPLIFIMSFEYSFWFFFIQRPFILGARAAGDSYDKVVTETEKSKSFILLLT